MTRINSAIPPKCLTDEHLIAEHREIKRLPSLIGKGKINITSRPDYFTLGKGHVLFFTDKLAFIEGRYKQLLEECRKRSINASDYTENFQGIPTYLFNPYKPTEEERTALLERIERRIAESRKNTFHYAGRRITKDQAIQLLHSCR